ncbi:MAG TPA: uL4 family ribosomal protein, partial [Ktedonobacteraceae bacterium]|nr:uL4 family ribosomal protein [Ktedonobacteraceae bacterium]
MRRLAIRSALSDKVANEKLIVISDLSLEKPRTKDMVAILDKLPVAGSKRVLMVLPERNENIVLSLRNIPTAKVQHVASINVVELLKHDCLILPVNTVRWLEMVFGEGLSADEASSRLTDVAVELSEEAEEAEEAEDVADETTDETADD